MKYVHLVKNPLRLKSIIESKRKEFLDSYNNLYNKVNTFSENRRHVLDEYDDRVLLGGPEDESVKALKAELHFNNFVKTVESGLQSIIQTTEKVYKDVKESAENAILESLLLKQGKKIDYDRTPKKEKIKILSENKRYNDKYEALLKSFHYTMNKKNYSVHEDNFLNLIGWLWKLSKNYLEEGKKKITGLSSKDRKAAKPLYLNLQENIVEIIEATKELLVETVLNDIETRLTSFTAYLLPIVNRGYNHTVREIKTSKEKWRRNFKKWDDKLSKISFN